MQTVCTAMRIRSRLEQLAWDTAILLEAAKGPESLPAGFVVAVLRNGPSTVDVELRGGAPGGPTGFVRIARTEAHGPCDEAWMVTASSATKGWGPLLYDVAIEVATQLGGGLMADRREVSDDAYKVWLYYLTRRPDVHAAQLDQDEEPHLTATPNDDCDQTQSTARRAQKTGQHWTEVPESKRFVKAPTVLKALANAGKLGLSGISPSELGIPKLKPTAAQKKRASRR